MKGLKLTDVYEALATLEREDAIKNAKESFESFGFDDPDHSMRPYYERILRAEKVHDEITVVKAKMNGFMHAFCVELYDRGGLGDSESTEKLIREFAEFTGNTDMLENSTLFDRFGFGKSE